MSNLILVGKSSFFIDAHDIYMQIIVANLAKAFWAFNLLGHLIF